MHTFIYIQFNRPPAFVYTMLLRFICYLIARLSSPIQQVYYFKLARTVFHELHNAKFGVHLCRTKEKQNTFEFSGVQFTCIEKFLRADGYYYSYITKKKKKSVL